jgi:ATP-binding cassette, subfamily B, bacterial
MPLLALSLTRQTIDTITQVLRHPSVAMAQVYPILWLIVAAAGVALAMNLTGACLAYVKAAQSEAVRDQDHVYEVLHRKSVSLDLAYYENPQFYDALHQSQTEATYRPVSILQQLLDAGQGAIALVLLGAVLPWLLI